MFSAQIRDLLTVMRDFLCRVIIALLKNHRQNLIRILPTLHPLVNLEREKALSEFLPHEIKQGFPDKTVEHKQWIMVNHIGQLLSGGEAQSQFLGIVRMGDMFLST